MANLGYECSSHALVRKRGGVLAATKETGKHLILSSITGRSSPPLFDVHLDTPFYKGPALVASTLELLVAGVGPVLGNDLAVGPALELIRFFPGLMMGLGCPPPTRVKGH